MSDKNVTLLISGNRMVVDPTTTAIRELLEPALSYTARRFLYGKDRRRAGGRKVELTDYHCYTFDVKLRLATSLGFYDRVRDILESSGYTVQTVNCSPPEDPSIFVPMWERLADPDSGITLRPGQDEFLARLFSRIAAGLPGRFDCPPGYGKSFLIAVAALLLPRARIHVASDRVPVLRDRIYPELCGMLPSVGIVGGGRRVTGCRVMCYTFDSLHHSRGDADILFVDECHEAAADTAAARLAVYDHSLNYGFSATHDMRLDNKDMRLEAMFGPVVYRIPYSRAQEDGLVVPIEVFWSDVIMDLNPCGGLSDDIERKRAGIWRNQYRNEVIAANARADQKAGRQQLITCETIEHVLALKKLLPDFEVVYAENGITPHDRRYFERQGLWPPGHEPMTAERRANLTAAFERGVLREAIVTTVWNVGVSFNRLQVLNRADAGGSPIMDTQIPGRVSRPSPDDPESKPVGIVRDYCDQFDSGFRAKAASRRRNYEAHGWTQHLPSRGYTTGRDSAYSPREV